MFGLKSVAVSVVLAGLSLSPAFAGSASAPASKGDEITLFAFGDSLTSGYGLPQSDSFPVKLEAALKAKGYSVKVINGGVAGDTTATALARLKWSLPRHVDAAIVELGANDAFRGELPGTMRTNLDAIIDSLKARDLPVLLAGMLAPPNLGPTYTNDFDASFRAIAEKHGVLFYPFFLEGVAMNDKLNQEDHIHPNPKGVDMVVAHILPSVERLLGEVEAKRAGNGATAGMTGTKDAPAAP